MKRNMKSRFFALVMCLCMLIHMTSWDMLLASADAMPGTPSDMVDPSQTETVPETETPMPEVTASPEPTDTSSPTPTPDDNDGELTPSPEPEATEAAPVLVTELLLGELSAPVEVPYGTPEEELPLPRTLTAVFSDGTSGDVAVVWRCESDGLGGKDYVPNHASHRAEFAFRATPAEALCAPDALLPILLVAYEAENIVLGFRPMPATASIALLAGDAIPFTVLNDNAVKLKFGDNISSITVFYLESSNWVAITEENAEGLPADTDYQFVFNYEEISVAQLLAADGQMVYEGLPDWFMPVGSGVVLAGTAIVGRIDTVDGKIIITFDMEWLETHKDETTLSGSFRVNGSLDWHKLPEDGNGTTVNGSGLTFSFEGQLAEKYGNVRLEKNGPTLIAGEDGCYYLEYVLTVTSYENIIMPGVTVRDLFGNAAYIAEYVGVTEGDLPNADPGNRSPWETSSEQESAPGKLSMDEGSMVWDIGNMQPNEVRTLTYYARIADDYVATMQGNPIQNTATVSSGDYPKDKDSAAFTPKNEVKLKKEFIPQVVGSNGDGEISYQITITAPETNSFTLEGLTLTDAFPSKFAGYLVGDPNHITVDIETTTVDGETTTEHLQVPYTDASFVLENLTLAPGTEMRLTYTINVRNIFFLSNDQVELTNTATVSKGNRTVVSAWNTQTLEKNTWVRKLAGEPMEAPQIVEMTPSNGVYDYQGQNIVRVDQPDENEFTVPKGSIQYQVVLNETEKWDLTSTTMKDGFDPGSHLKYVGYVQVQIFERKPGNSGELGDQDLLGELTGPEKTVWLKVDGREDFSFLPSNLGLPEGNYTYLLTYYARPDNMQDVGSVLATNRFWLNGQVGIGNGNFAYLPGIEVAVGRVIQGGVQCDATKSSWYYEPYSELFKTAPMLDNTYPATGGNGYETQYANGALYWVICLEGTIGNKESGFYVRDKPDSDNHQFNRDALLGIFKGPKGYDIAANFSDYADFAAHHGLTPLKGSAMNEKYFPEYPANANPDYRWRAENKDLEQITFPNGYKLDDDQALYIILRTTPSAPLPTREDDSRVFTNSLSLAAGGSPVPVDSASYIYTNKTTLFKESKGAYTVDKSKTPIEIVRVSNESGGDWHFNESFVDLDALPVSGTYAAWLLNINWDGTMLGSSDIIDYLPKGMELVYVDVNNFGNAVMGDVDTWPVTEPITELTNSSDWKELTKTCSVKMANGNAAPTGTVTTITYYNEETGQIRWRFSNLFSAQKYKTCAVNLRIICRVVDPDLFLGQSKTYVNEAALLDANGDPFDFESASVTINRVLDKKIAADILRQEGGALGSDGSVNAALNQLPFTIDINPLGEDMVEGDTLPALIDELSAGLELLEDTLTVTIGGAAYAGFTYTVEKKDDHQNVIISGLPDSTPMTISYRLRLDTTPGVTLSNLSNKAYWAGYTPPSDAQVKIPSAQYQPSGDVFTNIPISMTIIKVDADTHSKRLDGAFFDLYRVEGDELVRQGSTNSQGKVVFDNQDASKPQLMLNTLYCIREISAPLGYEELDEDLYFIIIDARDPLEKDQIDALRAEHSNLDVWYDSPEYSVVIENRKGQITATKEFKDQDGNPCTPASGTYRFGLFDYSGNLLETLTIDYAAGTETYYLNGVRRDTPNFTKYEPDGIYRMFELDANDQPVADGELILVDGVYYRPAYSTEDVTVNSDITVTNTYIAADTPQSLTVTKKVDGEGANRKEVFTFKVEIEGLNGEFPIEGNPTAPSGSTIKFEDGEAEVKLTHGQSITILCLPAGVSYAVTEDENRDYAMNSADADGTIPVNGKVTAAFVNTKLHPSLNAEKTLISSGSGEDGAFKAGETARFEIVVTNTGDVAQYDVTVTEQLQGARIVPGSGYTVNEDGTGATIEEIAPDTSVTVYAEYQVTQDDIDSTAALANVAVIDGEGDITQPDPAPVPKEKPAKEDDPEKPIASPTPTASPTPVATTAPSTPTVSPKPSVSPAPTSAATAAPTSDRVPPKTGDESALWLWVLLLILSGAGVAVTILRVKARRR